MKIEKKCIEYIARLSKLRLDEYEEEIFVSQLSDIITYIDKLNELDTKQVKPMVHTIKLHNVFRTDELISSGLIDENMTNAPALKNTFFKVPRVIE